MGKGADTVFHYTELVLEIIIKNLIMVKFRTEMVDELTLQR